MLSKNTGRKLPNEEYVKTNPVRPLRRPSAPKPWLSVTLMGKFIFPSPHFSPLERKEVALYLCVAEIVSSMAADPTVRQDSVQGVMEGFSICLRHIWAKIQVLGVLHNLQRHRGGSEVILICDMK